MKNLFVKRYSYIDYLGILAMIGTVDSLIEGNYKTGLVCLALVLALLGIAISGEIKYKI